MENFIFCAVWTSSQTRPDLSYQACEVNISIKNATICDSKTANKYIRKLSLEVIKISKFR